MAKVIPQSGWINRKHLCRKRLWKALRRKRYPLSFGFRPSPCPIRKDFPFSVVSIMEVCRITPFFCQVVESPDVVVAREEMYLNSLVREIGQFGKKAYVAFGDDMFVFEPKIKHITKQVKFQAIRFDAFAKTPRA